MKIKNLILTTGFLIATAISASANYSIVREDGGNPLALVQGREYQFLITNLDAPTNNQDVRVELSHCNYDWIPTGAQSGTFGCHGKFSLDDPSGELRLTLRIHTPGSISITVTNDSIPSKNTTLSGVGVQKYPVSFIVTPNNPQANANVPFPAGGMSITAVDADGVVVTAFEDSVQIVDSPSAIPNLTNVLGTQFSNGVATGIQHTVVSGGTALDNIFNLTFTLSGQQYYSPIDVPTPPHLVPRAQKVLSGLTLIPDVYNKIVMLFPGEQLVPGIGKSGNVTPQISGNGNPVSSVHIRRVDQYSNPILSNPPAPVSIEFTSTDAGDTAFPFTRQMTGSLLNITSGMGLIWFSGAGDRDVHAVPDGATAEEDISTVPVDPGNAETFTVNIMNVADGATITTDDIITAEIRAFGSGGSPLTTLFGQIAGAQLIVTEAGLDANPLIVDTNDSTLVPDNVVSFNAGVATVNLVTTKVGTTYRLKYTTPGNPAALSPTDYNVSFGGTDKIHFTIVGIESNPTLGETYTEGIYPGNSGTPPDADAGEWLIVEARITDRRWNTIPTGVSNFDLRIVNNLPEHYIEARNDNTCACLVSNGPNIWYFPSNGQFFYDANPAFDRSFRVRFLTAGPNSLVSEPRALANTNLGGGPFHTSTMTIRPLAYNRLVIEAPGETIRPGSSFTDGKEPTPGPLTQQAGVAFPVRVMATDQYYNPTNSGPYPQVNFNFDPILPGSFMSPAGPFQLLSSIRTFNATLQEGSDVEVFDTAIPSRDQTVSIPVGAGLLDNFNMILNTVGDKQAGVPHSVTIQARDKFDQVIPSWTGVVTLEASTGLGTMSPESVNITTNGEITLDIQNFTAGTGITIAMRQSSVNGTSPAFNVVPHPTGFSRLLSLATVGGIGETHAPGTPNGKVGNAPNAQVGTGVNIEVLLTDQYFNIIPLDNETVNFDSSGYHLFSPASGLTAGGDFTSTLVMHSAEVHIVTVTHPVSGFISTTSITGTAGNYARVQLVLPGETLDPGNTATNGKGNSSSPNSQKVSIPFTVTINAVDQFYNPTTLGIGSSDSLLTILNTPNVTLIPPNNTPGGPSPIQYVAGTLTRDIIISEENNVSGWPIRAQDQVDFGKTQDEVTVLVDPGPDYVVTLPGGPVTAGTAFSVTVSLEEAGVPVAGYNEPVFLEAYFPAPLSSPASGGFTPDSSPLQVALNNGQATVNLTYYHVEDIVIRLTDNFGRVKFSGTIQVDPSNLRYEVSAPTSVTAGGPATFDVTLRLVNVAGSVTTVVNNPTYQHDVDLAVTSLSNPTADGTLSLSEVLDVIGEITFPVSYTKAEQIQLQVSEQGSAFGIPDAFTTLPILVNAAHYSKLLVLAPGETHNPGILGDPTGKIGAPNTLDKTIPAVFTVMAVDTHWNQDTNYTGGILNWNSTDGSINSNNPVNQGGQFSGGTLSASIFFETAGTHTLSVDDVELSSVTATSVDVPVNGTRFEFPTFPTGDQTTCANFPLAIVLKDTAGNTVPSGDQITIEAIRVSDGQVANGVLDITNATLSGGTASMTQRYNISEDIRLRVTGADTITLSEVIHFVPSRIFYEYRSIPTEAIVNTPFSMTIQMVDDGCGTDVQNITRSNVTLQARSVSSGTIVTTFFPTTFNIVDGVGNITSARYDVAEDIYIEIVDNTGLNPLPTAGVYPSPNTIEVKPGALASIDNLVDFSMQSNDNPVVLNLTARDISGNPIGGQRINFVASNIGNEIMKIEGFENTFTGTTFADGTLNVTFNPSLTTNGIIEIIVSDADVPNGFTQLLNINVLGLTVVPASQLDFAGKRIPVNSTVMIPVDDILEQNNPDWITFYYTVDGQGPAVYNPSVGITAQESGRGFTAFTEAREYVIEWWYEICPPGCIDPISSRAISGASNIMFMLAYGVEAKLTGHPSPFNPVRHGNLTFLYPLSQTSTDEITIYDLLGQKVFEKVETVTPITTDPANPHGRIFWNGRNADGQTVANGGYIVRIKVGSTGQTIKTKILVAK